MTKHCGACKHHVGYWDEYGYDGCVCHNPKAKSDNHVDSCYWFHDEEDDGPIIDCPYFEPYYTQNKGVENEQ